MQLCERNSAAWRVFNLKFDCSVPAAAQYSIEYLRNNHRNISGDKDLDKLRLNQMHRTRLTTAGMAMIKAQGFPISLQHLKDCVQIYSDISNHIADWHEQTQTGANVYSFPPIEDFRILEDLMLEVWDTAKRLEPKQEVRSRIFDSLIEMNRRRNLMATDRWLRDKQIESMKNESYRSLVDAIEIYIAENI